jgi:hypothetical protein
MQGLALTVLSLTFTSMGLGRYSAVRALSTTKMTLLVSPKPRVMQVYSWLRNFSNSPSASIFPSLAFLYLPLTTVIYAGRLVSKNTKNGE